MLEDAAVAPACSSHATRVQFCTRGNTTQMKRVSIAAAFLFNKYEGERLEREERLERIFIRVLNAFRQNLQCARVY